MEVLTFDETLYKILPDSGSEASGCSGMGGRDSPGGPSCEELVEQIVSSSEQGRSYACMTHDPSMTHGGADGERRA